MAPRRPSRIALIGVVAVAGVLVAALLRTRPAPEVVSPLFGLVDHGELPHTGASFGATWADVDRDGRLDFLPGLHGRGIALRLVRPDLRSEVPDSCTFLPCREFDMHGTAVCDFDADGDWELYVTVGADKGGGSGPNELWMRDDDLLYRNHLTPADPMTVARGRGRGALGLRLDSDRYPELLVLDYDSPSRLFRFDGKT